MPPRYAYWTIIAGGLPTAFRAASVDFTRLLTVPLTDIYAPGTRLNGPNMPGDYRYWLAHKVDTTLLADGPHTITVTATDVRGNTTTAALQLTVENAQPG